MSANTQYSYVSPEESYAETLRTVKKLMLITYAVLTAAFVIFGILAILLVFRLYSGSVLIVSDFIDSMSWWIAVLIFAPIAGYAVTYAVAPHLIQKALYTDIELREESLGVRNQMMLLEEHVDTLVSVVDRIHAASDMCNESAREAGVSANDSRTATGRLEDEIRGLRKAAGRAYEVVGLFDEAIDLFGKKTAELNDDIESLEKTLDDLANNRAKVLEESLQPMKNSLLALRKENVQMHRASVERIKLIEDADEDLHEFLLELIRGVSSAYRSHEDKKRVS
jgi:archaellum component FlaC